MRELMLKKEKEKNKKDVIIDFDKMSQYQIWKYIDKLKDFERKETQFHSSLKDSIVKLHRAVSVSAEDRENKEYHKHEYETIRMKEKSRKKKNSKQNIDLSPVQNKSNNTANVIRIKKTK